MVTVNACIQQIPPDASGAHKLEVSEISEAAENYLSAVAAVESKVPPGWRVLYVRTLDQISTN